MPKGLVPEGDKTAMILPNTEGLVPNVAEEEEATTAATATSCSKRAMTRMT